MLTINEDRLWDSLMQMARIGATDKGGCNRQALTDEDKEGRDLFCQWAKEAGCTIRVDQMGNIFARRLGTDDTLPPVIAGSHLDTQPTGGKFDGVYGVLAALEVIRSLNDHGVETSHPIEAVVWTNEEGARFSPAMIGSGVWCGEFELSYGHQRQDREGRNLGDELERIGYLGDAPCQPFDTKAAFEVHIEQGPILENEHTQIGVLTGVQGMRWYDLEIQGESCHAGPTPMEMRRDPVMALHTLLAEYYALASQYGPSSRITFGDISASPGARNTVPENVKATIDLRHPDEEVLGEMEAAMQQILERVCSEKQVSGDIRTEWKSPAIKFDDACVTTVQDAVDLLGFSNRKMVSGAGHDSVYVSRVVPTSMIFVPCERGLSHNEEENASKEDISAGCNVLLHAILKMAE